MSRKNYTPEEIAAMHDRNENFHGTLADFQKMTAYKRLAQKLHLLEKSSDGELTVTEMEPNPREMSAVIYVDMPKMMMFKDAEALEILSSAITMSDAFSVSTDGNINRMLFVIQDIWKK